MTHLMFLFAALSVLACVFFGIAAERMWSDWAILMMIVSVLLGLAAVLLTVFAILIPVYTGYDKRQCYRYGDLTQREVKFKRFSYWTWDCYVRTKSGNWISQDQVRGVDQ